MGFDIRCVLDESINRSDGNQEMWSVIDDKASCNHCLKLSTELWEVQPSKASV